MSCLLPQFKCLPDSFSIHFKTHTASQLPKSRDPISFRTECILSTTSAPISTATTVLKIENLQLQSLDVHTNSVGSNRAWSPQASSATGVLDRENMQSPSLEARSNLIAASRPWTYTGAIGPPMKEDTGINLPSEFLTSEEAVIAAAAAEAVALARAAVKVAKGAVMMAGLQSSTNSDKKATLSPFEVENSQIRRVQVAQLAKIGQTSAKNEPQEASLLDDLMKQSEYMELSHEEVEPLEAQLTEGIAVRSRRQTDRKAKRERAADKAAATVVSVKSGYTRRKKRGSVREVDYSDPLHYLRGTTSSSRLLTAKEEQELSKGIQDLLKLEKLREELTERCGDPPSFMQWADAAGVDQMTLRKRINHGTLCKDKMIKSNLRLVISIAKNYQGSGLNLQDLVQEGCRGLVRGAEKFDGLKGFKFSTYAHWWIKQAVRKSLSDQSRTIRLPFHMVEAAYKVKEAKKQFFSEQGRQPTNVEVCNATGLSMKRLESVLLLPKAPRSLDQLIGPNKDLRPSDVISDPRAETLDQVLSKQYMRQDLENVMNTLNAREKQVVRWRFGLEDGRMKTLQEIGELMGVSRERIRQIESCAFRKLKNKKRSKHLFQYLVDS